MLTLSYQDAHLHLQDTKLTKSLEKILADTKDAGIDRMVVNGTSPADWDRVTALYLRYPELIIPSYGLHPWKTPFQDESWKQLLEDLIETTPGSCVGECGLDRWMKAPNQQAQEDTFRFQLELAARHNKPISIHVLKAWGWLFDILESSKLPARGIMLHSFGGSKEVAQRLVKLGAYFSFSGYYLQQRKANVQEAFRHIPVDRILIETDAPDMLPPAEYITHPLADFNHPANLPAISNGLARILEIPSQQLAQQLKENFSRYFEH